MPTHDLSARTKGPGTQITKQSDWLILHTFSMEALCHLRHLLPEIRRESRLETQSAISEHIASLVASQLGVLSAGLERTLDSKLQGVERRLAAVEFQPSKPNADVESLSRRLQSLQFATNEASSDILARVERLELRDNQTSLIMYGLPEEGDEHGPHLRRHVSALLVSAASQHGSAASSVSSAKRLGSARFGSSRPRPVMVCCQTEGDKHAAFKARQSLLEQKIRVDDYLARAQVAERKERAPLMAHLRSKFPQLIPHWRGSCSFIITEGQGARPYKDTDASQAHDCQPAQAPQPPPAASARPRRPPRPAASRPAQTPAAALSWGILSCSLGSCSPDLSPGSQPGSPPATAPVEGDPATHVRPKGRTKKVVRRRSGVAQAAANASQAGQLAAAPAQ